MVLTFYIMEAVSIASFNGYIETPLDAAILVEACRTGVLLLVNERLNDKNIIYSGDCFIFEESSSGIKRWTDKVIYTKKYQWGPSRIHGHFLIYKEIIGKKAAQRGKVILEMI